MRSIAGIVIQFCLRACSALSVILTFAVVSAADPVLSFDAKQLLLHQCVVCHSGDEPKGKLDLTSREKLELGGESGPAIVANLPEKSPLWLRVDQDEMPPKHPLSTVEKQLMKDWIGNGATWPGGPLDPLAISSEHRAGLDWWSLQPLKKIPIPLATSLAPRRQPIDDFILEKLDAKPLSMSAEAERRVLIRRASFDLLGLPPSPEDVDQFVSDDRPDVFERLIDKLLASPHYGERWARHWLDVVRFGESNGFERDLPRPHAWHYRDWVIVALNEDVPYDDFARWQLAGDLIDPDNVDAAKAVGFLVAGAHDTVVPVIDRMRAIMRQDELEDIVGTVSQTFLGLTLNCARCHDHKFDPITTREYYQFASSLAGIDHGVREFKPSEVVQQLAAWQTRIDQLLTQLQNKEIAVHDSIRDAARNEVHDLQRKHAELAKSGIVYIYSAIATQSGPMKVHQRGSVTSLGEEVEPAGLVAIQGLEANFGLRPDAIESHRRRRLANWITDTRNPLFARVMTNRIWHYHFGSGLVETPNDLGFHAGIPLHRDLLNWLSGEFQGTHRRSEANSVGTKSENCGAFSLKRLHRVIMTSATYRQSSKFVAEASQLDATNQLLWRVSPRRLEAEEVRDSMLEVAGGLNNEVGGKGYSDTNSYFFKGTQFYDPIDPTGYSNHRRTVYRMWARGGRSPFLDNFDCPDPSTTAPRRSATVTPLQALSLLNHPFGLRMADLFANRLVNDAGSSTDAQVQRAYRLLYGRDPAVDELKISVEFIARRGLMEFCRAMWNSSELLFLD